MREIKFRQAIFHPVTKIFLEWHYWGLIDKAFVGVDTGWQNPTIAVENSYQYTGLKDKNGKESYVDDVLKWRNSTFRIIWDDECACVMLRRLTGSDGMKEIPAHNIKDSEIIGSIFENPELLEK